MGEHEPEQQLIWPARVFRGFLKIIGVGFPVIAVAETANEVIQNDIHPGQIVSNLLFAGVGGFALWLGHKLDEEMGDTGQQGSNPVE